MMLMNSGTTTQTEVMSRVQNKEQVEVGELQHGQGRLAPCPKVALLAVCQYAYHNLVHIFEPDRGFLTNGWGIAVYLDGKGALIIKEALPGATSRLSKFLSTYDLLTSKTIIAHVRKANRGAVRFSNSHPFSRVLGGRDYAFAHNGTIHYSRMLVGGRFSPVGSTDSERLFCAISDHIDKEGIRSWSDRDLFSLREFLLTVNHRPTKDETKPNKINLLLSDGATVICYNDTFGRGTLHRLMSPCCNNNRAGGATADNVHGDEGKSARSLVILATKPLNKDPGWVAMASGELCAFRDGGMVFSSEGDSVGAQKQSKKRL
jgi:predicted glutamine amidotransferase